MSDVLNDYACECCGSRVISKEPPRSNEFGELEYLSYMSREWLPVGISGDCDVIFCEKILRQ